MSEERLRKDYSYGTLSPITSSSGKTEEIPDNYLEYYVKKSDPDALTPAQEEEVKDYQRRVKAHGLFGQQASHYVSAKDNKFKNTGDICANCVFFNTGEGSCCIVSGKIQANGHCDFAIIPESSKKGGEKDMTEKGYDVGDSEVTNTSYDPGITSTTEPDPISTLAMQKGATYDRTASVDGVGAFSTTANSTVQAPPPGATTEPTFAGNKKVAPTVAGEAVNKDDGVPGMQLCNMCKASCCSSCDPDGDGDCDGSCCQKCVDMSKGWDPEEPIEKRDFSDSQRKQLAREGKAQPDGSYPIVTTEDLKNAIRAWGRGGAKPSDKAHIMSRARALGAMDLIPDNWKKTVKKSVWGNAFLPVDSIWES